MTRTEINKKSDFDFIVLDNEGNAVDMPSGDFTLDLWTWGSKCRFRASSIGGVLKGCNSDNGKLRVYVDNPGFVPGKLVGEWVSYISSEEYPDGTQRTCRYISDFGIDMVDGDSQTNEVQVLAMMQYIQGESAYEIACEYGFDGTEQEWLDSLALPANEAAAECRTLMTELSNAEAQRVANEDVRTANEGTRVQQESARVTAEQQRVQAESDRALAETNRDLNEQYRSTTEQKRIDNEAARVEAEKNRVANESSRVSDESLRVQAETERVEAEAQRETAEQQRVKAENDRAMAEVERAGAEQRRKYSESGRQDNEAKRKDAEEYRIKNENGREATESSRVKAENERVSAESSRKTAEDARIANEATRQTNEQARVAAETSRESAETDRADAEAERVEAEAARAEEFATFTATLAAKEDAANKVTSINADADDVHYPSAKAVKDSLAKVKNIEVTPEMLSESTKQFINASGGGTITNFADDEDLTTVDNALKLADKTYDPITYSGMGRKYLRKNLVDGKNILTQAMLPSANTIYIIQYDYDINGATITIPENCTLDFQGGSLANGTVTFSNTEMIGAPRIYTNFGGVIANDTIHTKWFINLPDDADCSQTLRRIVKLAYTSSLNSSGWRMCKAIHIDAGIYTVKNSLIDSSLGVTAGRFNVTGDGYVNTTINYDNSDVALIDNQQIFGFSKFEGISFVANNNATFANLVGGGSGNSQSFVFENCIFQKWTTILNSSGETMNSEITFRNCKISSCGNTENKCMLFILNNPQAVNWRFIATDIESCYGTYFEAIRGFNISIYQGSMIPYSNDKDNPSIFLHIPTNAIPGSFGPNNSPHLIVNQSRFELRNYTHLIKTEYIRNAAVYCIFNNVGLGGSNLATDEDFYTLYLTGKSTIKFNNCENFSKYKLYHIGDGGEDRSALIYSNTSLFNLLLANSKEETYSGNNVWSFCYFHNIDTGEVSVSRSKSNPKSFCINHNANEVTTTYSTSTESNTIAIYSGHQTSIKIKKPMILTGLTILHTGATAYGDMIVTYKVTTLDADGNDVDTIMMTSTDNRYSRRMSAYISKNATVYGVKITISDNFYTDVAVVVRGLIKLSYL